MSEKFKFVISAIVVAVVAGFILILLIGSIGSCATMTDYMTVKDTYRDGFIVVDERTGVMYYKERGNGGVTVLLNEDGTPMIWNSENRE